MDTQENQTPSNVEQETTVSPISMSPVTPLEDRPQSTNHSPPKNITYLIIAVVLMGGLAAGMLSLNSSSDIRSKASNEGPVLSINPTNQSKQVGSTASVGLTINTKSDTISAAQLKLAYDPSAIQIISFTPGTLLPVVLVPETHANGILSVTLGVQPTSPFMGAGIIGTLQVKILSAKQSNFTFTSETQVAAIGKTTNALVGATGGTITGTSAGIPTLTPTRIPGSTATPAPTRVPSTNTPSPTRATDSTPTPTPAIGQTNPVIMPIAPTDSDSLIVEENKPIGQEIEDYSPFVNMPQPEAPKRTVFDQIFTSILEFFKKLF